MERRKFLIGTAGTAIGTSALVGSGAFTQVDAERDVDVRVETDDSAYLGLGPCPDSPNSEYLGNDGSDGLLTIELTDDNPVSGGGTGINGDAYTLIDDLFQITNQGTQEVNVLISGHTSNGFYSSQIAYYVFNDSGDRVTSIYGQDREPTMHVDEVDEADGGVTLAPGDSVCVGLLLDGFDQNVPSDNDSRFIIEAEATSS